MRVGLLNALLTLACASSIAFWGLAPSRMFFSARPTSSYIGPISGYGGFGNPSVPNSATAAMIGSSCAALSESFHAGGRGSAANRLSMNSVFRVASRKACAVVAFCELWLR